MFYKKELEYKINCRIINNLTNEVKHMEIKDTEELFGFFITALTDKITKLDVELF